MERDFSDRYILPRNNVEMERLNLQHALITKVLGGRLILDDTVSLGPNSRVLDSATGAASWLLDLVRSTGGNLEAMGIDLSLAMFPSDVPSNVKLYEHSVLDLPKEWNNSFDLINQRLLLAALTESQWLTALSELYRVLQPGGMIQFVEYGNLEHKHDWSSVPALKKMCEIIDSVHKNHGVVGWDIGRLLPEMLDKRGSSEVQVEEHRALIGKDGGEVGKGLLENLAGVGRTIGAVCVKEDLGVVHSLAEVDAIVEQMKRECDEHPGIFCRITTFVARKPTHAA